MKTKQILFMIFIFISLFCNIKSNFFTKGIRKTLGFTLEKTGIKDGFVSEKSVSQSPASSSDLLNMKDDYQSKKDMYLDAKIKSLIIGLIPLTGANLSFESNFIGLLRNGFGTREFLPCYLGGCTFAHHALALLDTNRGYILIEYGAYLGKDNKYPEETFYYIDNNGARFTHLNFSIFYDIITNNGTYKFYDKTFYTEIQHGMKLKDLFQKVSTEMNLTMFGYNGADNNCQDFIANVIKILKAKRLDSQLAKMHNLAKLVIPPKILEAFEDNEDYYILTTLGKVPVLGVFTDFFGSLLVD